MKKQFYFLFIFVVLNAQIVLAQTEAVQKSTVIVSVKDSLNFPVDGATINLLRAEDQKLVKAAITNTNGYAEMHGIAKGKYVIKTSHAGYALKTSAPFEITADEKYTVPSILMSKMVKELADVTVAAKKPFIERKLDKLIVNVDNSIISAGSTAFEVLEKSPGIVIDQNDNISLQGKAGVIIMMDGKPSPLSGSDLSAVLRGLPANAVERIEIIANPSARYDASGNAGIINIVMKKDKRLGTNGVLSLGLGQGIYHRRNGGINFNHRNKKINVFGNYNYNFRTFLNYLSIDREFFNNGQTDERLVLLNNMLYPNTTNSARLGADYFVNNKTTVGVLVSGFIADQLKLVDNQSTVRNSRGAVASMFTTNSRTKDLSKHYSVNLNLKHVIDSLGKEITVDLDNAVFDRNSNPDFITSYYDANHNVIGQPYILTGGLQSNLSITSAKSDFVLPMKNNAKIEAGIKTSFVKADNDLEFFDRSTSVAEYDSGRSNHFVYEENINAFYTTLSKEFKKWSAQVGLRGEQANIRGVQRVTNDEIDTSYFQFFPSAFINYNHDKKHTVGLSYSRRIRRPSYNQLNPFQSFIDLTSFNAGNPYLRPQFTNNFELSYTFKQRTTVTFSYARDKDVITWIILPKPSSTGIVSVETYENIKRGQYYGMNISSQLAIKKWWNAVTNAQLFTMRYDGVIANTQASNGNVILQATSNHSFTLPKRWSGEVSFNYQSPEQSPFAFSKSQWMMSAGVQKIVMQGKGTFRFNVSDVFRTFYPRVTSEFVNYRQFFTAARDTRMATLNFSYRFGKNTITAARRRTTGVEEEKSRAQ